MYVISEKSLHNPKLWRCIPMDSSQNFIDLAPMYRSMIDFKLIFYMCWKVGYDFILLHVDIQLFQPISWKYYSFSIAWSWHLCQKSIDHKCMVGSPGQYWTEMARMNISVFFLILEGCLQSFPIKYNISCGFFINPFY